VLGFWVLALGGGGVLGFWVLALGGGLRDWLVGLLWGAVGI
jgi:hypothetical protein